MVKMGSSSYILLMLLGWILILIGFICILYVKYTQSKKDKEIFISSLDPEDKSINFAIIGGLSSAIGLFILAFIQLPI